MIMRNEYIHVFSCFAQDVKILLLCKIFLDYSLPTTKRTAYLVTAHTKIMLLQRFVVFLWNLKHFLIHDTNI